MSATAMTPYEAAVAKARKHFEDATADHELDVLRDDGLYRHLRFQKPGTSAYYYDLVTWPGYLAIVGDCGDYVFARIRDMVEFFEGSTINPDYWSEKLQAPRSDAVRVFSEDSFQARVTEWADDVIEQDDLDEPDAAQLRAAVAEQLIHSEYSHYEDGARRVLEDFEHEGRRIETWEWDLRELDHRFLWCCWAILRGLDRYRAGRKGTAAS